MKKFVAFVMAMMFAFTAIPAFAITEDDFVAVYSESNSETMGEILLNELGENSTDMAIWLLCHSALATELCEAYIILDPSNEDSKFLTSQVNSKTIFVDVFSKKDTHILILASNRFSYMIFCENETNVTALAVYMIGVLAPEFNFETYVPD